MIQKMIQPADIMQGHREDAKQLEQQLVFVVVPVDVCVLMCRLKETVKCFDPRNKRDISTANTEVGFLLLCVLFLSASSIKIDRKH